MLNGGHAAPDALVQLAHRGQFVAGFQRAFFDALPNEVNDLLVALHGLRSSPLCVLVRLNRD